MKLRSRISSLASSVSGRAPAGVMPEYNSYEGALRDSESYEDPRLIEVVSKKTQYYREALRLQPRLVRNAQVAANMFVFMFVEPKKINVLELGGACGATFFEMTTLLGSRIGDWAIVETPAMVATARKLAVDPAVSFHSDFPSACDALDRRDLLVASGVLQYTPDPLATLDDLLPLGFNYLYASRTIVNVSPESEDEIFTKQTTDLSAHGPGPMPSGLTDGRSSQPMTIVGRDKLLTAISTDYELLYCFHESDERSWRIGEREVLVRDVGFLAKRRTQF